jgi:ferredoxin
MMAKGFEFTGDFLKEWNNSVYCRVQKILCRFKEQARACHSCEKCGLNYVSLTSTAQQVKIYV